MVTFLIILCFICLLLVGCMGLAMYALSEAMKSKDNMINELSDEVSTYKRYIEKKL